MMNLMFSSYASGQYRRREKQSSVGWKLFNPVGAVTWSMQLLHDYKTCHPSSERSKGGRAATQRWETPPSGRIKLKFDAAYDGATGKGGLRMVARNDEGEFVVATSMLLPYLGYALYEEVEVYRAALDHLC